MGVISWIKAWWTGEDEEEQRPKWKPYGKVAATINETDAWQVARALIREPELLATLADRTAREIRDGSGIKPQEYRALISSAIQTLIEKQFREEMAEIKRKMEIEIDNWIRNPLIMQRMDRMEVTQEDFITETRGQLNELTRLVRGLLGSAEDRKQNPVLTEILERLEALESRANALERRAGIASPGPR